MKSGFVVKLIEAHRSGSEDAFKNAVNILADDEEKKQIQLQLCCCEMLIFIERIFLQVWQIVLYLKCLSQRKVPFQCLKTKIAL